MRSNCFSTISFWPVSRCFLQGREGAGVVLKCQWPWNPKACQLAPTLFGWQLWSLPFWTGSLRAASSALLIVCPQDGCRIHLPAFSLHPSKQWLRGASQLLPIIQPHLWSNPPEEDQGTPKQRKKNAPSFTSMAHCCSIYCVRSWRLPLELKQEGRGQGKAFERMT